MNDRRYIIAGIAAQRSAEARRLFEIRFALGVSIIGAIKGAGDLDKLGVDELRVVTEEVERLLGYIKLRLKGVTDGK